MPAPSDEISVSRARLCELGGVERRLHGRWISAGHLLGREHYGLNDLMLAVALDELHQRAGKALADAAWGAVRAELGSAMSDALDEDIPEVFDVVVDLATRRWFIARDAAGLAEMLPRGRSILVVDVASRIRATVDAAAAFATADS